MKKPNTLQNKNAVRRLDPEPRRAYAVLFSLFQRPQTALICFIRTFDLVDGNRTNKQTSLLLSIRLVFFLHLLEYSGSFPCYCVEFNIRFSDAVT